MSFSKAKLLDGWYRIILLYRRIVCAPFIPYRIRKRFRLRSRFHSGIGFFSGAFRPDRLDGAAGAIDTLFV
jgi:hypothetical protein